MYTDWYDEYAPSLAKQRASRSPKTVKHDIASSNSSEIPRGSNPAVTEPPSSPGYWGNRDEGNELHGPVRTDPYTLGRDENQSAQI